MLTISIPTETHNLCTKIAKLTDTVTLSFSCGKDSLCCWIILKRYFKNIYPYFMSTIPTVPTLSIWEEYLSYCEEKFETKIDRFINGDTLYFMSNYYFQPLKDYDKLNEIEYRQFKYFEPAKEIKEKYNCFNAWSAAGIKIGDNSLITQMFRRRKGGIREKDRTFYPIYNWSDEQVFDFIEKSGYKLCKDYLFFDKSAMGIPLPRMVQWLYENRPDDLKKVEQVYPLIKVMMVREDFKKLNNY